MKEKVLTRDLWKNILLKTRERLDSYYIRREVHSSEHQEFEDFLENVCGINLKEIVLPAARFNLDEDNILLRVLCEYLIGSLGTIDLRMSNAVRHNCCYYSVYDATRINYYYLCGGILYSVIDYYQDAEEAAMADIKGTLDELEDYFIDLLTIVEDNTLVTLEPDSVLRICDSAFNYVSFREYSDRLLLTSFKNEEILKDFLESGYNLYKESMSLVFELLRTKYLECEEELDVLNKDEFIKQLSNIIDIFKGCLGEYSLFMPYFKEDVTDKISEYIDSNLCEESIDTIEDFKESSYRVIHYISREFYREYLTLYAERNLIVPK